MIGWLAYGGMVGSVEIWGFDSYHQVKTRLLVRIIPTYFSPFLFLTPSTSDLSPEPITKSSPFHNQCLLMAGKYCT
jgi:hypothetical protein